MLKDLTDLICSDNKECKRQDEPFIGYLGMNFYFSVFGIASVIMKGHIHDLLLQYGVEVGAKTPASDTLFHIRFRFGSVFLSNKYFYFRLVRACARNVVQKRIDDRQINNGESTSESSRESGRKLLRVICDDFLKLGDPISMNRRFALVATFLAI
jgi:hypothetical protein